MARLHQLVLALVFLTRLPLGRLLPDRILRLADAAWAFPLAGALVGALAALPLWLMGPGLLPAALSVGLAVWLTGALHEDGLADFADAGGGQDRQDRLRIMSEPTIGSYGAMALIVTTALRILALAMLGAVLGPWQLIAAAAAGRAASAALMRLLPPARPEGLGRIAGRPGRGGVAVALLIAAALLLAASGGAPLPAMGAALAGLAAAGAVAWRAHRLLGGQSGDVLGAASLVTETALLLAFAMLT